MKPGVVGERYYPSKDPNIKSRYISLEKMKKKKAKGIQRAEKNKHPLACLTSHKRLPSSVSLKSKCHSVYDQLGVGSCTSNSFCSAYKMMCHDKTFEPSRLYVYWKERLIEDG